MEHSIGKVATKVGVSKTTLQSWEAQGLIPKARRKMLTNARYWDDAQVLVILDFARSGYLR